MFLNPENSLKWGLCQVYSLNLLSTSTKKYLVTLKKSMFTMEYGQRLTLSIGVSTTKIEFFLNLSYIKWLILDNNSNYLSKVL